MSVPNVIVNVSIVALLLFLVVLIVRYMVLIFLSFLQHSQARLAQFDDSYLQMKASILVPAFNEGKVIEQSIRSLLQLDYPNYEIIVIDDGSTDDTLRRARTMEGRRGNVRVRVLTQRNAGKAAALNHGLRVATGDVIVCMDSDSKLSRDTLRTGMRYFIDPTIGAVAGNVKVFNRTNLLTRLQALEYIEGLNLVRRAQAYLRAVNIVPGPIGLFRRTVLYEVGGWDSDTYAEDCDLTLKILTTGYGIEYEPDAISYTEAPEKWMYLLKQRYRWTRGILQSMRKHKRFLYTPGAGWRVMVTMWQMIFEGILWPLMNVLAQALFLFVALLFGMSHLIVLWWVQLTMLDTIAALHAIAIEKEKLSLAPLAFIYRVFFIQMIDVAKLIATIEELIGFKMSWGKLERQGRI
ncbi:MAG: glycosyltransferase family 2 protein [Calditrichaeota bacterium]|nr:glycosyltransferase family 2 protein [Calditrichota bacterium]